MRSRDPGPQARRAAARRLGANWTELHRQEEEAARSSPLHDYVYRYVPWLVIVTGAGAAWNLMDGATLGLVEWLALGAPAVGGGAWLVSAWRRHRAA